MSSGGSGSGSSGATSGLNRIILLLLGGLTLGGIIVILGPLSGGDDKPRPAVVATEVSQAPVTSGSGSAAPSSGPTLPAGHQAAGFDKTAMRRLDPNAVVVSITAYGMPARVSIVVPNESDRLSNGTFDAMRGVNTACVPDTQFPNPCVSYAVVRKGATVNVVAGNSRAGFWPNLAYIRGPGCDFAKPGDRDVTCIVQVTGDMEFIAVYYGDDTPTGEYLYPTCTKSEEALTRARASSPWVQRC